MMMMMMRWGREYDARRGGIIWTRNEVAMSVRPSICLSRILCNFSTLVVEPVMVLHRHCVFPHPIPLRWGNFRVEAEEGSCSGSNQIVWDKQKRKLGEVGRCCSLKKVAHLRCGRLTWWLLELISIFDLVSLISSTRRGRHTESDLNRIISTTLTSNYECNYSSFVREWSVNDAFVWVRFIIKSRPTLFFMLITFWRGE